MRLQRHPASEGGEGVALEAEAVRAADGRLALTYVVSGHVGGLRLPRAGAGGRGDELWRHTCFEAFVRAADGGYYELNFAPSTQWAAYRFDGYRSGMAPAELPPPRIEAEAGADRYALRIEADVGGFDLSAAWRLALSAVIEDAAGRISYWALAHAAGKPDFHHPDSFVLDL